MDPEPPRSSKLLLYGLSLNALFSLISGALLTWYSEAAVNWLGLEGRSLVDFEIERLIRVFGLILLGHGVFLAGLVFILPRGRFLAAVNCASLAIYAPAALALAASAPLSWPRGALTLAMDGTLIGCLALLQYLGLRASRQQS